MRHWPSVGLLLAHRLRRLPNRWPKRRWAEALWPTSDVCWGNSHWGYIINSSRRSYGNYGIVHCAGFVHSTVPHTASFLGVFIQYSLPACHLCGEFYI